MAYDGYCVDYDRPTKGGFDRCYDCNAEYREAMVAIEGVELAKETAKAFVPPL